METTYDTLAAKTALSTLLNCEEDVQISPGTERLCFFKSEKYRVHQFDSPPTFKLVKVAEDVSEFEEATFVAYGIILEKDLPPIEIESRFLRDDKSKKRFAEVARQYVAITGLNIEVFDKTLEGLGKIHNFFEDSLPNEHLQSMDPLLIEDNIAMACYTRYFHAARYCRQATAYPFRPDVDPNGDLERLRGASYVHTEDNAVQYLGKKVDNGKTKYFDISPTRFQKGDVVEVMISFFCIRTRFGDLKMLTSLKSLILVNDQFREKARESRVRASISGVAKSHIKRRFVETEGDETLADKYARMEL